MRSEMVSPTELGVEFHLRIAAGNGFQIVLVAGVGQKDFFDPFVDEVFSYPGQAVVVAVHIVFDIEVKTPLVAGLLQPLCHFSWPARCIFGAGKNQANCVPALPDGRTKVVDGEEDGQTQQEGLQQGKGHKAAFQHIMTAKLHGGAPPPAGLLPASAG